MTDLKTTMLKDANLKKERPLQSNRRLRSLASLIVRLSQLDLLKKRRKWVRSPKLRGKASIFQARSRLLTT